MEGRVGVAADQLRGLGEAEQLERRRVDEADHAAGVDAVDPVADRVEDALELAALGVDRLAVAHGAGE
ncbi:MAG: hypothetical protein RML12_04315 [Xanthomonadales bacterium]|nr:hypothetical protein [Xanthomonadales bacterium]